MLCHADGAYARSAAAVRRGERLVQVQVADVRTDKAGICQAYLGIHIGAVHIYLCAAGVYDAADFHYFRFKDTVCGRVGNHQGGEVIPVFFRFGAQVVHIHIALCVAGAGHGSKSRLDGRSRVGAVCRCRYQYFVAVPLPYTFLIGADDAESCIFACRTGVGLQADAGKAGNGFQLFTEIAYQFAVTFSLVFGHQRMYVHEFRAAER